MTKPVKAPGLLLLGGVLSYAVAAVAAAQAPVAVRFTAISENVSGAGEAIKINLSGWSADAQRDELVAAWTLTSRGAAAPAAGGGRGGARGGAGARGGRGGRGA